MKTATFSPIGKTLTLLTAMTFVSFISPFSTTALPNKVQSAYNCQVLCDDGTQLVTETKDLIAGIYHVSTSTITTYYSGQHTDGRFIYPYSFPGDSGYVLWTVSNCQIIGGDDMESF